MSFAIVYRGESPSPVTGPLSFTLDAATALFAPAVTRWGMFIAIIEAYFIIRLLFVAIGFFFTKTLDWSKLYK